MTIVLPDDALRDAGFDEDRTRLEFACWLFANERAEFWPAAQIAGLTECDFEVELLQRRIPIYRYNEVDFEQDMATAEKLGL